MIYVIQEESTFHNNRCVYAGSSAHQALLAASKMDTCRISIFKNGHRYIVEQPTKAVVRERVG